MAKLFLTLLLSVLSLISFASSTHVSNKDIKGWCRNTPYPKLCQNHFKSHSSFFPQKKSDFRNMAIKATLEEALSAQSHNKWLGSKCRNEKEKAAWADCLQLYQNTINQLNHTIDPKSKCSDVDAQTWLSTALTNLETCNSGFRELGVSDFVLPQMTNNVSRLICNTLAINKVNGTEEQTYTDGFPSYVSAGDRKLLQASSPRPNLVVAQDGSGNYRTINAAIDAASKMTRSGRFVIYVKAGLYKENILIGNSLKNIMLTGDGMKRTIITGSRSVGGGYTTFNSATLGKTISNLLLFSHILRMIIVLIVP